jgi:hypothetical protein
MAKHPSEIIKQVVLKEGYRENADGTITHPYEDLLKTSPLERLRRKIRLAGRPGR